MTEIRKAFHGELAELCTDTVRLAALVRESVNAGTDALLEEDLVATERVMAADLTIDQLAHDIEDRVYEVLARQAPMAVDLRVLVTILRILHELERAGDGMVNVAKGARRLYPYRMEPRERGLIHRMREQAIEQLNVAMGAFADRDATRAAALADMDDAMDDLQKELFAAIFASPAHEEASVQRAVQVALVGRHFERIADHAVNIGDRVAYMVTGRFPGHTEYVPDGPGDLDGQGDGAGSDTRADDSGN